MMPGPHAASLRRWNIRLRLVHAVRAVAVPAHASTR